MDETPVEGRFPWEAILAYIPLFCLYPWSLRHRIPGLEGHARQGLILFIIELFLLLILIPVVYRLIWLGIVVLAAGGIWSAYRGRPYRLPVLDDLVDRLARREVESSNQ